jgi:hypothetical protein
MSDSISHSTQICIEKEWNIVRNDEEGYLYAYYNDQWVSYDDITTVTAKVRCCPLISMMLCSGYNAT